MYDKNPHEKPRPYDRNPNAKPNPYDQNPHAKYPSPYDQNPHKKPNPNRNSIIIAVCITVAACAVIGVSLFFLISTLNKPNDTSKPTETTESTVQVTQTSGTETDTAVSTAAPPSAIVPTSTDTICDLQPITVQPTNPPPIIEPTPEPPVQEDVAAGLFQRLSGWDLRYGFENGSQTISFGADQSFSILHQHRVFDNGQRIMEYFSKSGSFTDVTKINDFTYTMRIADTYDTSQDTDATAFSGGLQTKAVDDTFSGMYDGTQVTLYTPDAPLSQIPSEIAQNYAKMQVTPNGDYLGYYCLVNSKGTRYYAKAY